MPIRNKSDLASMQSLPVEIARAASSIDSAGFAKKAAVALGLNAEQEIALKERLDAFLVDVWKTRSFPIAKLTALGLTDEQSRALNKQLDSEILAPLISGLNELGVGPESVLYATKRVQLTGSKLNGHTTERITIKGSEKRSKRGFVFPRKDYFNLTLDIDYCERGRWGDYETTVLRFDTSEEMERFLVLLKKAIQVGYFLNFVDILRRFHL